MRIPFALRAFLGASLLFLLSCAGTEAVCRHFLHRGTPYDYPLLRNFMQFPDYQSFIPKFRYFHSPEFYTHSYVLPYPAPTVGVIKLFMIPQPVAGHARGAVRRYEGTILLLITVMAFALRRFLIRRGIERRDATLFAAVTYLCAFPAWFDVTQGNIEWFVCGVLMLGVWAFCTRRFKTAATCIGVAGAMKIFPIIFIALFLPGRKYKEVLLTALSAAIATVVGLWLVCPNIHQSMVQTIGALGVFEHGYMVQVRSTEVGFDHSLFALVKLALRAIRGGPVHSRALRWYLPGVAVGGCVLYFWRIRKLPLTNQVLCLTVAAIVLPPVSYEYTLLHLYGAFVLLLIFALEQRRRSTTPPGYLIVAMLLLAFLFAPESEFIAGGVRFGGQLKCVALLGLWYVGLRYRFGLRSELAENAPASAVGERVQEGRVERAATAARQDATVALLPHPMSGAAERSGLARAMRC